MMQSKITRDSQVYNHCNVLPSRENYKSVLPSSFHSSKLKVPPESFVADIYFQVEKTNLSFQISSIES